MIFGEIMYPQLIYSKRDNPFNSFTFKTAFLEIATRFYKDHVNFDIHELIVKNIKKSVSWGILFLK